MCVDYRGVHLLNYLYHSYVAIPSRTDVDTEVDDDDGGWSADIGYIERTNMLSFVSPQPPVRACCSGSELIAARESLQCRALLLSAETIILLINFPVAAATNCKRVREEEQREPLFTVFCAYNRMKEGNSCSCISPD